MNHHDKLFIGFNCLILAYAYALYGEHAVALFLGTFAAGLSIYTHSVRCVWKNYYRILCTCFIGLVVLHVTHLHVTYPTLPYLCLCNAIFVWMYQESSFKVLDFVMPKLLLIVLSLLVLTLIMPLHLLRFFVSDINSAFEQVILLGLIFLPSFYAYLYKCKKEMHRNHFKIWLS